MRTMPGIVEITELVEAAWTLIVAVDDVTSQFDAEIQPLRDILTSDPFFEDIEEDDTT
jgi:hypothetical protein